MYFKTKQYQLYLAHLIIWNWADVHRVMASLEAEMLTCFAVEWKQCMATMCESVAHEALAVWSICLWGALSDILHMVPSLKQAHYWSLQQSCFILLKISQSNPNPGVYRLRTSQHKKLGPLIPSLVQSRIKVTGKWVNSLETTSWYTPPYVTILIIPVVILIERYSQGDVQGISYRSLKIIIIINLSSSLEGHALSCCEALLLEENFFFI